MGATAALRLLDRKQASSPQLDNLSLVIFLGRFQYRSEPFDWRFWDNETREGSADYAAWVQTLDTLERQATVTGTPASTLQWRWIWNDIRQNPLVTLQSSAVRLLTLNLAFVNSRPPEAFRVGGVPGHVIYWLFHTLVNLATVTILALVAWYAIRQSSLLPLRAPLWAPWVALLAFHAFTYAEPRYLFPGQPGMIVLAAAALEPVLSRLGRRHPSRRELPVGDNQ